MAPSATRGAKKKHVKTTLSSHTYSGQSHCAAKFEATLGSRAESCKMLGQGQGASGQVRARMASANMRRIQKAVYG